MYILTIFGVTPTCSLMYNQIMVLSLILTKLVIVERTRAKFL